MPGLLIFVGIGIIVATLVRRSTSAGKRKNDRAHRGDRSDDCGCDDST